jgi:hypothetical protein
LDLTPLDQMTWSPTFGTRYDQMVKQREEEFQRLHDAGDGPSPADRKKYHTATVHMPTFGRLCTARRLGRDDANANVNVNVTSMRPLASDR